MKNSFDLFEIPTEFSINQDQLEKKYLEFQQQFHPDKSSSSETDKTIEINQAYKILSDDFLRACHLLALKGIDILHHEKKLNPDLEILEEIMELQENIAKLTDKNAIIELKKSLNQEIFQVITKAMNLLASNEIEHSAQMG